MDINEQILHKIVRTSLNEVMSRRTFINRAYRVVEPYTGHLYSDSGWQGVDEIIDALENAGYETSVSVENGGYRNSLGGNTLFAGDGVSYWKEYKLHIEKDGMAADGRINCHAAGTVEDVFSAYDMTVTFW